jgi:hypothetical protein
MLALSAAGDAAAHAAARAGLAGTEGSAPAPADHRVPLAHSPWSVWREALLRTTGFPADGLDLFTAPQCAVAADAYLNGTGELADFIAALDSTIAVSSVAVQSVASHPLMREAVTWQNSGAMMLLDALARNDPGEPRNRKRRYREQQLSRYWQRYCAKTETIGFFGPTTWVEVDPEAQEHSAVPGPGLISRRRACLEPWALVAYGARLAENPAVRRWLPTAPVPHYALEGHCLHRPDLGPVALAPDEAMVLSRSDGNRPAALIVAELVADSSLQIGSGDDGYRLIEQLVRRKLLRWDANVPLGPATETVLDRRIAAIGDDGLRQGATQGLDQLRHALAAVAAAAGDQPALSAAMAALDARFVEITGREPRRRPGQTYAGRSLCYEDTTRDLNVVIGRQVLEAVAAPLALLLQAARWVTSELAMAYEAELARLVAGSSRPGRRLLLSDVWYPATELFWGRGARPVDAVVEVLASNWSSLFGLTPAAETAKSLAFSSAALAGPMARLFSADRPGWSSARIHSPDLHICASSADAINGGDFTAVLGELHISYATLADRVINWPKPSPDRIMERTVAEFGRPRMLPLFPAIWSKDAGRLVQVEPTATDWNIGFARTASVETERLIPAVAIAVCMADGAPVAVLPSGERVPLIEVFATFLCMLAVNAFRHVSAGRHTPRVSIDRLVVFRETWRMTIDDIAALMIQGNEAEQYLAARRLVASLNLPDRCFAKIASETKPVYVDFTSPLYLASFCSLLRAAQQSHGGGTAVTLSEMLPTPDQTWVPDSAGRKYFAELRLQVTDPAYARTVYSDGRHGPPLATTSLPRPG